MNEQKKHAHNVFTEDVEKATGLIFYATTYRRSMDDDGTRYNELRAICPQLDCEIRVRGESSEDCYNKMTKILTSRK